MQEESKEIQVKTFKKVKIYLADQKQFQMSSDEELRRLSEGVDLNYRLCRLSLKNAISQL